MHRRLTVIALACLLAMTAILCHMLYIRPWREERERRHILQDVFKIIAERGPKAFTSCEYVVPSEILPDDLEVSDYIEGQAAAAEVLRRGIGSAIEGGQIAAVIPTYHIPMVQSPRTFEMMDPKRYSWKLSVDDSEYEVRWITSALLYGRNGRELEVAFFGASSYIVMIQIQERWYVELAFDWCDVTSVDNAAASSACKARKVGSSGDGCRHETPSEQPTNADPASGPSPPPPGD